MNLHSSKSVWILAFAVGLAGSVTTCAAFAQESRLASPQGLPDIAELRNRARSRVELNRGNDSVEILLFAADERTEVQGTPYCGASEGQTKYFGTYRLLAVVGNKVVSEFLLGPDHFFVPPHPHGQLHKDYDRNTGEELVLVLQYESCNTRDAELFRLDENGVIQQVAFLDKDGTRHKSRAISGHSLEFSSAGEWIFGWYSNVYGTGIYDSYRYENGKFVQTRSWMDVCTSPSQTAMCASLHESARIAAGEAHRVVIAFLSFLAQGDYKVASYYYPSPNETLRNLDIDLDPGIALLERHCKRDGGNCLAPFGSVDVKDLGSSPFVFTVSFRGVDGERYSVGAQIEFQFRVTSTEAGFKVLDLPPTGPPPPR